MSVGDLMSYNTYIMHILMSRMMMSMTLIMFSRAKACSIRIREVLSEQTDIAEPDHPITDAVTRGEVEFRNVSFRYHKHSEESVLKKIDLTIEAGSTVGIIGSTGCGKTTLVSLIPRLYDTDEGEVLVDGVNVKDYSLQNLRDGVGMVLLLALMAVIMFKDIFTIFKG
jgi:ATP-binding cassette subfamily B protein